MLVQYGTLSGIQAALAWAVPTVTLWALAWRRRHELPGAMRQRYVSTLVRLSGPVRSELLLQLSRHPGFGEATPGFAGRGLLERETEIRVVIRNLYPIAGLVLLTILVQYDPAKPGDQVLGTSDVPLARGIAPFDRRRQVQLGGAELLEKRLLSKWLWLPDHSGALVELHPNLTPGLVLQATEWVRDALVDSGHIYDSVVEWP